MSLRILLTGKDGQVGGDLQALLPRLGEVVALGRSSMDLTDEGQVRRMVSEVRPHAIVNAAAYTAVDRAETDQEVARLVNAEAPAVLAREAQRTSAILIHYSTDYVFDGSKTSPYTEEDRPNPASAYGRTKLAGEEAIRLSGAPHLIFRTAWVYATRGRNFLLTILRLATQREELRVVADQTGAPTWSREIARATAAVIGRLADPGPKGLVAGEVSGTYHMTAGGTGTWHDFANAILDQAARVPASRPWFAAATGGHPLLARTVRPITTSEYPTPARRPAYSVLSNEKLWRVFGIRLPDWRDQLHEALLDEQ